LSGLLTYNSNYSIQLDSGAILDGVTSIAITPNGNFLYVANTNSTLAYPSSIIVFERDAVSGKLNFQKIYYNGVNEFQLLDKVLQLQVSPDGSQLYALSSVDNSLHVFSIDQNTGELTLLDSVEDDIAGIDGLERATAFAVAADGKNIYTTTPNENKVGIFQIQQTNLKIIASPVTSSDGLNIEGNILINVSIENTLFNYASDIKLSMNLPENVQFTAEDSENVSCSQDGVKLSCELGMLQVGDNLDFHIGFNALEINAAALKLKVTSDQADIDASDNETEATILIPPYKPAGPVSSQESKSSDSNWYGANNAIFTLLCFGLLVALRRKY
ncbi:MAG: beta-propeller fold lactonase family protein, partial [Gammaproteobacteria bacterium]|nr:beta-propeller fold lactonase family protein [Gammaproteobacteria bacterium]